MAMGTRKASTESLLISTADLPVAPKLPFYAELKDLLESIDFDHQVELACRPYYTSALGRPSMPPSVYFRLLLLGYLVGVDSERTLALYARDSLNVRRFLGYALHEPTPAPSTLARTRRRIPRRTQQEILGWALRKLREQGLERRLTARAGWTAPLTALARRKQAMPCYRRFVESLAEHAYRDTVADERE